MRPTSSTSPLARRSSASLALSTHLLPPEPHHRRGRSHDPTLSWLGARLDRSGARSTCVSDVLRGDESTRRPASRHGHPGRPRDGSTPTSVSSASCRRRHAAPSATSSDLIDPAPRSQRTEDGRRSAAFDPIARDATRRCLGLAGVGAASASSPVCRTLAARTAHRPAQNRRPWCGTPLAAAPAVGIDDRARRAIRRCGALDGAELELRCSGLS